MLTSRVRIQLLVLTSLVLLGGHALAAEVPPRELNFYGATDRIRGFDPVTSADTVSAAAVSKVYEGLFEYEYLARPYTVRPLLAAAMPEVSDDGLTYTIRLKKGVRFADDPCFEKTAGKGRELRADDFIYSWKRIADVRNRSTCFWIFEDRIVGLDEFHKKSAKQAVDYDELIEGLKSVDDYTLQVKLTQPYPQLIWVLTMSYSFAVPREAVKYYGKEFLNHPVGTGPFVIKEWKWRNYGIEYARNPNYHGDTYPAHGEPGDGANGLLADAGKPIPFLDHVHEYIIADESTEWLVFLSGDLAASGISRNNFDAVVTAQKELTPELTTRGIRLYKAPRMDTRYLGFNMEDPVVGASADPEENARHRKLRQALSCAVDIDKWVEFFNNRMLPATGPIPPGVAGYDPNKPAPYKFDLARAKKLLAEAGYADGHDPKTGKRLVLSIEIGNASDPEIRQSTDLLADFFSKLGVELKPSYNNWPEFLKKMERKQSQMFQLAWTIDYPDAENFLQLFYSKNESPGPNHANYHNPAFDQLYEKIRTMQDTPARTAIYQQMSDIVIEDAPWVFLAHPMQFGLFQPWLKNFKPSDFPYPNMKFYKVDPALIKR